MNAFSSAWLFFLLLHTYEAAFWNPTPANLSVLYKCTGNDAVLPWTYNLSPGDVVESIEWFFHKEKLAVMKGSNFLTMGRADHVEHILNGKVSQLKIKSVSKDDMGDYSIVITGQTASKTSFVQTKILTLDVAEGLQTGDQQLHVILNPKPVWDKADSRWSAELICGMFRYDHAPPFDVQWMTPSGKLVESSGYRDGTFFLHLTTSLEGGEYTCQLSKTTAGACLKESVEASTLVDATGVKVALLEARLDTIEQQKKDNSQEATPRKMVAFHATSLSFVKTPPNSALVLDHAPVNVGMAYDNNTGVFTVPVAGLYEFHASFMDNELGADKGFAKCEISVDGTGHVVGISDGSAGHYDHSSMRVLVRLSVGMKVSLKNPLGSRETTYYNDKTWSYTTFSGFLIHAY